MYSIITFLASILLSILCRPIFGASALVFPLSLIIGIALGLTTINKKENYNPTFLKSLFFSLILTLFFDGVLNIYWLIMPTFNWSNLNYTKIYIASSDTILLEGVALSFILAIIYRSK